MAMLSGLKPEVARQIGSMLARPNLRPDDLIVEIAPLDLPEPFLVGVLKAIEASAQDAPGHGGHTGTGSDVVRPPQGVGTSAGVANAATPKGPAQPSSADGPGQEGRPGTARADSSSGPPAEALNQPMAGSVADATPGSLAIAKPGRSTAVDLTDVSKSRPHSLAPAGADPNAGEEGEEDNEEEDESGGEGKEEKKDGEESEAEPEMPDEKSVTFGESSDLRVNADVVSALWPKNIGKLRAPAAQVASWKAAQGSETAQELREAAALHGREAQRRRTPGHDPLGSGAPKMKAKELDAEFFRIQERLFPLSWGLAYVSDYLEHLAKCKKTRMCAPSSHRPWWTYL